MVLIRARKSKRKRRRIDLDEFCSLDYALISPEGGGFFGAVDEVLAEMGRSRRVVMSLPSALLAPNAVRGSELAAVVPKRLVTEQDDSIDVIELPFEPPTFGVLISWHQRLDDDPAHIWLRNMFIDKFRNC